MKIDRQKVLDKYGGHCAYCGNIITLKTMQIDHKHPVWDNGTNDFDNLMPSCRRCNHYKRGYHLDAEYGYRKLITTLHERIRQPYINQVAIDYGIMTINEWDGLFYFEKVTPQGQPTKKG